jgi:hypothetical protein
VADIQLTRDERGRFVLGSVANPAGRPKGAIAEARQLCREHVADAISLLVNIIHSRESRDRDKIAAAEILLTRGLGRPIPESELLLNDQSEVDQRERILGAIPEEVRRRLVGGE